MWNDSQDCPKMALSDCPRLASVSWLILEPQPSFTSAGGRQSKHQEICAFLFADRGNLGMSGGGGGVVEVGDGNRG